MLQNNGGVCEQEISEEQAYCEDLSMFSNETRIQLEQLLFSMELCFEETTND